MGRGHCRLRRRLHMLIGVAHHRLRSLQHQVAGPGFAALLFAAAMCAGLFTAAVVPGASGFVSGAIDPLIMVLLTVLFLDIRFTGAGQLLKAPRTLTAVMGMNFLIIPILAFGLTALAIPGDSMLRLGVLIYLLFPCTDWFLGFIRITGGNTVLGAALIPINLCIQVTLYPFWISLFTGEPIGAVLSAFGPAALYGIGIPVGIAVAIRLGLGLAADHNAAQRFCARMSRAAPWILALTIFSLFAAFGELSVASKDFGQVLLAVFCYFVVTFILIELISRGLKLHPQDHALLTFTVSARNAPLMLAITATAFGDEPVLMAAIVLGMLLEFPHLTALTWLLRRRASSHQAPSEIRVGVG